MFSGRKGVQIIRIRNIRCRVDFIAMSSYAKRGGQCGFQRPEQYVEHRHPGRRAGDISLRGAYLTREARGGSGAVVREACARTKLGHGKRGADHYRAAVIHIGQPASYRDRDAETIPS